MKFKELAYGAFIFKNLANGDPKYQSLAMDRGFLSRLQKGPSLAEFDTLREFLVNYGVRFAPKTLGQDYLLLWPRLKPHVERLAAEGLEDCDLNSTEIQDEIAGAYTCLLNGAWGGDTVVAKVLHFFNVSLFVMWDEKIYLKYRQGSIWSAAYLEFLKTMQGEAIEVIEDFKKLSLPGRLEAFLSQQLGYSGIRPLTKLVDDYNWVTITRGWPVTIPDWLLGLFIKHNR